MQMLGQTDRQTEIQTDTQTDIQAEKRFNGKKKQMVNFPGDGQN